MKRFERGVALLALLLSVTVVLPAVSQVSGSERSALIDLFHATGGDDWDRNDGWLGEEGSECDWYGVHCLGQNADDAHVRALRLPGNGLGGVLPETLNGLERVGMIDLRTNDIGGPIPSSLADLAVLHSLELDGNRLTGPVPGELLASPATAIRLRNNRLDGYTKATGAPQGTISIDLSGNPINSLPPASWRDSGALIALGLNRTALSGEINFDGHPWPGLRWLSLNTNAITGLIGVTPGTLPDLYELSLADNNIVGPWPIDGQKLPALQVLDLTGNGLESSPPANLSGHPALRELRLDRNALRGQDLAPLFAIETLRTLKLQNNPLQALPTSLPGAVAPLLQLDLASTELEGDPPEWFGDLSLRGLNLSGNRLSGALEPWLAALQDERWIALDLSRNQFEGPLPESLLEIDFAHVNLSSGPGLNLCWNRFDEPFDAQMEEFLDRVHVAGSLSDCNDRALTPIDLTISGSWYYPERVGKGYTIMLLDNGQLLHYWFGYPGYSDALYDEQMWSLQMVAPVGDSAIHAPSLVPYGGRFGQGLGRGYLSAYGNRNLEMTRLADGTLNIYSTWAINGRHVVISPPPPPIQERFDHQRLTRLAGTTCDSQSPFQQYSGAWYNPEAAGEGFILEVLPNDRGVVYWFTYAPDDSGRQAWMIGDSHFEPVDISIGVPPPGNPRVWIDFERLIQPVGTVLGPHFDGDEIEYVEWGSLTLEFYHDGTAHAFWDSALEEFGSGDYPIEPLARPMLADCEN
jgi:Leucine-rich repeat (LRR) protein